MNDGPDKRSEHIAGYRYTTNSNDIACKGVGYGKSAGNPGYWLVSSGYGRSCIELVLSDFLSI